MSKAQNKVVTLEDIIKKKDRLKSKDKDIGKISVPSLGGYVTVAMPDRTLMADAQEIGNPMDSNVHLVYNSIIEPDLKDKETQKAFGVHTPKELLEAILSDGEIANIAKQLMKLSGYTESGVELVKDLKN